MTDKHRQMEFPTFDANYAKRLAQHCAVLIAYEDTSLAHDEDRVMLAACFLKGHCEMIAAEVGRFTKDGEIK